jgi:hypothetical protein
MVVYSFMSKKFIHQLGKTIVWLAVHWGNKRGRSAQVRFLSGVLKRRTACY